MNTPMYELAMKNATYEIAKTLELAVDIHEQSFNVNTRSYEINLAQAVSDACRQQKCWQPRLIFLLLQNSWDDACDWARDVIAGVDGP